MTTTYTIARLNADTGNVETIGLPLMSLMQARKALSIASDNGLANGLFVFNTAAA